MSKRRSLVLQIRLEEQLVESRGDLPWLGRRSKTDLRLLLQALRRARSDRRVSGLLLKIGRPDLGWSKTASLRRAVDEFRTSGKPTLAFLEGGENRDYTLATACETVVMAPAGMLSLVGLRAEAFFFKDLLEEAGLEAQIESVGEYKSAGEMFSRREMSGAYREQLEAILRDISDQMVGAIAAARGLAPERVRSLLEGGPYRAEEALEAGLIDRVGHLDFCEELLKERLGGRIFLLGQERYRVGDGLLRRLAGFRRPQVALIYAVGLIGVGEGPTEPGLRARPGPNFAAARTLAELLKRARERRRVKAVVVRVESPGGSGIASDMIWREMALVGKEKPLVVSMGDVAASGGYYIATAADAIVAEPSTLTGSIGVLGGKLVASRLLDRLGIHREFISLSSRSGFGSPLQPYSEEERERLRSYLRHFYEKLFLPKVAEGRKIPMEKVEELARGRVWTGAQAKERGLVDEMGDLDAAIRLARQKAGIPPEKKIRLVTYARRRRLREMIPFRLQAESELFGGRLGELARIAGLFSRQEPLFLMPFWLRIK